MQISPDHLDILNYETQLLAVLIAAPSIAEKHSRYLIPTFFSIAKRDDSEDDQGGKLRLSTRQRQQRTIAYLELLAHFVNPKASFRSEELHSLYLSLLSKGEPQIQGVALRCLMTYKSPNLLPYEKNLKTFLDDAKFRDALAHFAMGTDSQVINPQHRDEVINVSIRLLYGIITSRRGRSSTAQGLATRKQAVVTALSGCSQQELSTLIDLMLEPFHALGDPSAEVVIAGRQQLGYLSLLSDVLRFLGPQISQHWPRILRVTINLVANAQSTLTEERTTADEAGAEEEAEADDEIDPSKGTVPLRNIRTIGIKRLVQFLRTTVDFDFKPYLRDIFSTIISSRLEKLEIENTQAPSGILDLIAALAPKPDLASSLVDYDERTLPKVFACMIAIKVKPAVIARVFDIIEALLADDDPLTMDNVLKPHIHALLQTVIRLVESLEQSPNNALMSRLLGILSRLAAVVTDGQQAQQLAALLAVSLRQSNKQLSEKGKVDTLHTLQKLYSASPDFADPTSDFFVRNYDIISNLFQTLFLPSSRRALVAVLETFAQADATLQQSVYLVAQINAYSSRRLEEPDFEHRLNAFAQLNDTESSDLPKTVRAWTPLLRSALFFIQDPEELSIRTNASALLQRFISLVGHSETGTMVDTLLNVIMPGLRRVLRSKLELVRSEALQVISHAAKICTGVPMLAEMHPLLTEDDEANFFVNICHIQVHRRARALRRLREACGGGEISETTLSNVFLPIVEHIITGSTDVTDHHLVNEAISTIGILAGQMRWSRYYALIMRYIRLGSARSGQQKLYIRAVSSLIDGFHFSLFPTATTAPGDEVMNDKDDAPEDTSDAEENAPVLIAAVHGPSNERIAEIVLSRLLPALSNFVSQKGDTEYNIRIPLALPTIKLASALPSVSADVEILKTITTVSQILRSKDQDTRDIARDTICKIAVFLGPDWLVRVLKELQNALQRGPQKHVVAVVSHAILALATSNGNNTFSNLDDAVEDAVRIAAEVVWGESGKDVESEGFKTKMREVRGATSRGFDTLQLVARLISPSKIGTLLAPLGEVMHSSQAVKTMQYVDEALRRIAIGLNANTFIRPEDLLSLCYSLISGNSRYLAPKRKQPREAQAADNYKVQMKRDAKVEEDFYPLNAHKFVSFGLNLFSTAFRRGRFDFDNVDILARMGPLVNAIGDTLYSPTSSILLLGLKATAAITRCPLPQVDSALPIFISNIFKILKLNGGTAETEVAQTAFKTLAVILRDCNGAKISDDQLKYLLEVINPDLEEPDRQTAIFTMFRAIVGRRFVVPEVYNLMDRVSSIMVTSQSTHVQETCRGVLMQFLLDYPQGKARLRSQLTFLVRNLDYVFESGRLSVMELMSAVFIKFSDEIIEEYADLFFVALVAVLANDEAAKCRMMAGELIKQIFKRMDGTQQARTMRVLQSWVDARDEKEALASASLAVFALLADGLDATTGMLEEVIKVVMPVIEESALALGDAEQSDIPDAELKNDLAQNALSAAAKAIQADPNLAQKLTWSSVVQHLLFPHDRVRIFAASCLALLFTQESSALDLFGDDTLLDIARKACILIQGSKTVEGEEIHVAAELADQLVKVLLLLAEHWAVRATSREEAKY